MAAGVLLAGERGRAGERYILGNRNTTLREMLEMLAQITGLSAPKVRLPYAAAWFAVGVLPLLFAADVIPDDNWLRAHGVVSVMTLVPGEGTRLESVTRQVR